MKRAKTLMIQGTASNVGKSVLTAAFCRLLYRRGLRVAPFKAQNMSNNSFVTAAGGEIGRAQAVQAMACGIEPTELMNPVLLKPGSDMKAQVIVKGRPAANLFSIGDAGYREALEPVVRDALDRLRADYDVVVIEGAGSPAEMNLKDRDLVNMNLALYAKSPVLLCGDIDWGGIFAQLVGTYELLDPAERGLVKGFLINKFRGDPGILEPGLDWIENRTGIPVAAVLPFLSDLDMAEEDSIACGNSSGLFDGLRANTILDAVSGKNRDVRDLTVPREKLLIDVMWLPRISNFTDFEGLARCADVFLRYLHQPDRHRLPDLIIIPGTKSTMADLEYLHASGLAGYVMRAHRAGVPVLGICGGYQMLGRVIRDPGGAESNRTECSGLGILPLETDFETAKITGQVEARCRLTGETVRGYEIHMGRSRMLEDLPHLFEILKEGDYVPEGAFKKGHAGSGDVYGTYLHGIFETSGFLNAFIGRLRRECGLAESGCAGSAEVNSDGALDRLASVLEQSLRPGFLERILNEQE